MTHCVPRTKYKSPNLTLPLGSTDDVVCHSSTKSLLLTLALIVFIVVPLYLLNLSPSPIWVLNLGANDCDIFRGRWVEHPTGPYYTNKTCPLIFDQQNCMKFGRSDTQFLKWRWKPERCELPLFQPLQFLEIVRGKSMAFVGDSLGRNHVQSLLCLLTSVAYPIDVSNTEDLRFRRWHYKEYEFTLAAFWSPYLVKAVNTYPTGPTYNRLVNVYLDEANSAWADHIEEFDYVIFSAGQWFFGPQIYYENNQIVGCYNCQMNNVTQLSIFYGHRRAFRTAFKTPSSLKNYKGMTFLRTLSPAHLENGEWNTGGSCNRTQPITDREAKLEGDSSGLYLSQVEELWTAESEGKKRGLKFRVIDATEAMLVRPDGHPNHYGHWPDENVTIADCVHWCLPGPIDTWNEFLLEMLKRES